ncbi:TIGR04255 family protein [Thermaerobacillus caldiproteolyticus]|uniref:TIGR04255 family protein n=1 Tax=Thermaerobacillus caldiproteolyticus TaxID=247480 RepID=UPI001889C75C|nr:TIGR04255 family protein [Anoxybacillus caldiproteolyticus]QPA31613.1 TIGR04255 family protein [Anoxybacillus caldiproteolyticus]
MERKYYKNPPVKEVICEFKFDSTSPWDSTIPGLIYEGIKGQYPKKVQGKELEIGISNEGIEQNLRISERLQLSSEDEKVIIQIGPHHLIINSLIPYTNWDDYLKLVDQILNVYISVAEPVGIERTLLRYINEIRFESDTVELKDYFNFYPYLGEGLPPDYSSFILGVQIPFEDDKDILRLQMNSTEDFSIILDLTYFSGKTESINFEKLYSWLDKGHERIVSTFEACIKDSLRKIFGESD